MHASAHLCHALAIELRELGHVPVRQGDIARYLGLLDGFVQHPSLEAAARREDLTESSRPV